MLQLVYISAYYWKLVSLVLLRCWSISNGFNGAEINALEHPEDCQRQMALINMKLTTVKLLDRVGNDFHVSKSPHLEPLWVSEGRTVMGPTHSWSHKSGLRNKLSFHGTHAFHVHVSHFFITRLPSQRRHNLSSLLLKSWQVHRDELHQRDSSDGFVSPTGLPSRIWSYWHLEGNNFITSLTQKRKRSHANSWWRAVLLLL